MKTQADRKKILAVQNMSFRYARKQGLPEIDVLDNISMSVKQGDLASVLGPSGCGKTTLLNIMAGFVTGCQGRVSFQDHPVDGPSPERAVVFQSAALFPWLTVKENIAFGLRRAGRPKEALKETVEKYLQLIDMPGFDSYYPHQLSGGMQQRVSMARALVLEPRLLLMDEPFASLDAQTRLMMQELLLEIHQKLTTTVVFITHDVEEALYLSDHIYIMSRRPGRIIKEIAVPFPKPRTLSIRSSRQLLSMKQEMLDILVTESQTYPQPQLRLATGV